MAATQWLHIYCANSQKLTFCDFCLLLTLANPCANMDPTLFFQKCKQQDWDKPNEVKTHGYLLAHQKVATQWLHIYCVKSQEVIFCDFVLNLWPLKILAPTWIQIYFFQKWKQQYWDKLNEVKAPWVLVGAASSKHIKSACRTAWTFIWPLIYCALALRKCLENY